MNRRALLLGTGALLVGEPVRRAYSFLQANPLAVLSRDELMAHARKAVTIYITERLTSGMLPTCDDLRVRVERVMEEFVPVARVTVSTHVQLDEHRMLVNLQTTPQCFDIPFELTRVQLDEHRMLQTPQCFDIPFDDEEFTP